MAAITPISSVAVTAFKSGAKVFDGRLTGSLVSALNTVITGINTVITRWNAGTLDALVVAGGSGTLYAGGTGAGISADGTNPPTLDQYRIQDQHDGSYHVVTYNSGGGAHAVGNFSVV